MSVINREESFAANSQASQLTDEIGNFLKSGDIEKELSQALEDLSNSDAQTFLNQLKSDGRVPQSIINNLTKRVDQKHASTSAKQAAVPYHATSKETSDRKTEMAAAVMSQRIALQNKLDANIASSSNHYLGQNQPSAAPAKQNASNTHDVPSKPSKTQGGNSAERPKVVQMEGPQRPRDVIRKELNEKERELADTRRIAKDFIRDELGKDTDLARGLGKNDLKEILAKELGMPQLKDLPTDQVVEIVNGIATKEPGRMTGTARKAHDLLDSLDSAERATTKLTEELKQATTFQKTPKGKAHSEARNPEDIGHPETEPPKAKKEAGAAGKESGAAAKATEASEKTAIAGKATEASENTVATAGKAGKVVEGASEGIKVATTAGRIAEAVGHLSPLFDALMLEFDFFTSFAQSHNLTRQLNTEKGFAIGMAASLVGASPNDLQLRAVGKDVVTKVLGAEGITEKSFNKGLKDGYAYAESLPVEERNRLREEAFKMLAAHNAKWYPDQDRKGIDGSMLMGAALLPAIRKMFEKAREEAEAKADRERRERHDTVGHNM